MSRDFGSSSPSCLRRFSPSPLFYAFSFSPGKTRGGNQKWVHKMQLGGLETEQVRNIDLKMFSPNIKSAELLFGAIRCSYERGHTRHLWRSLTRTTADIPRPRCSSLSSPFLSHAIFIKYLGESCRPASIIRRLGISLFCAPAESA